MEQVLNLYKSGVEAIAAGDFEQAANVCQQLRSHEENIFYLLSNRLSMKVGNKETNMNLLKGPFFENGYWGAEASFVKGLWSFKTNQFKQGKEYFILAAKQYSSEENPDRIILAKYNAFIGKIMADDIPSHIIIKDLFQLVKLATDLNSTRYSNLIHRQLSYEYFRQGRHELAIKEGKKALELFRVNGPHSDYQLSLCHLAQCEILKKDLQAAKLYLQEIIPPIDERVEFPYYYLSATLENKEVSLNSFTYISRYWKDRLLFHAVENYNATWDIEKGVYLKDDIALKLKQNSLEGKLIRHLIQGQSSKNLIIERLWPEVNCLDNIDNRLHRLISRVNKKFSNIINFDGTNYTLKHNIRIFRDA